LQELATAVFFHSNGENGDRNSLSLSCHSAIRKLVSKELMVEMKSRPSNRLINAGFRRLFELSRAAGWNRFSRTGECVELAPDGCLGIEANASGCDRDSLCYQQRLAGLAVLSDYRGSGFRAPPGCPALGDRADSARNRSRQLDATDQGRPLYEGFGFQAEQAAERWARSGLPKPRLMRAGPGNRAALRRCRKFCAS
jgi:hypothetical protein